MDDVTVAMATYVCLKKRYNYSAGTPLWRQAKALES
jgi:hypothetical protein